ncbi:MAG: 3-keto-5-aminohexanoate cleavage protein, partial [Pseudomonadota bacterium]
VMGATQAYPSEFLHMQTEAHRIFGPGKFHFSAIGVGYPRQYTLGALSIGMFGHVRVGLEDNIFVRKGRMCKSNLEMVEDIKVLAEMFGRDLATPDEAREMLKLKGQEKVNF